MKALAAFLLLTSAAGAAELPVRPACDLHLFTTAGSLGVVKDKTYTNCVWPFLEQPTALFATGSSGIKVQGPPTPRNVIFPAGTVALGNTRLDVLFLRNGEMVSEVTAAEADNLVKGRVTRKALEDAKTFRPITESKP